LLPKIKNSSSELNKNIKRQTFKVPISQKILKKNRNIFLNVVLNDFIALSINNFR